MSDVFGRLLGASVRRVLVRTAPVATAEAAGPGAPRGGATAPAVRPPAMRPLTRRWFASIENPDRRGLALFEERPEGIYATIDNGHYPPDLAQPVFQLIGDKVFPTVFNTHWTHGLACYEIRAGQVFPTLDNPRQPFGVAVYDIR